MSRTFNPNVMAFVPRSVEAAAKAICSETLTYPLPAKSLSVQSPRHIHQPLARHILNPRVQAQRLELMENVRIVHPPAAPAAAIRSKRYRSKVQDSKVQGTKFQGRKKQQRRGKQPLFDYCTIPRDTNHTNQPLPSLYTPPVVDGSTTYRKEAIPQKQCQLQNLQTGAKNAGCLHSPFLPKTAEEYIRRKRQNKQERSKKSARTKKIKSEEQSCPKVESRGRNCMGGNKFESNHSAVLAVKTIWCPRSWRDEQTEASWPLPMEYNIEGVDRHKNGFGRFLPVPRSEDFEWRLASPEWLADPKGTKYPVWDRKGPVPHQEKRFAWIRSELDCIIGTGLCVDELVLFDRSEETAWENAAGIIGKTLWEEIEEDERDDIADIMKKEGEASETEEGGKVDEEEGVIEEEGEEI